MRVRERERERERVSERDRKRERKRERGTERERGAGGGEGGSGFAQPANSLSITPELPPPPLSQFRAESKEKPNLSECKTHARSVVRAESRQKPL